MNNRGLTLFEVLISISVASIVIMLLMSLLSSTLITKNEIDYSNQLDNAIYEVNTSLSRAFQDMGYKSFEDLSCEEGDSDCEYEDYASVILLITEFRPIILEDTIRTDRSVFTPYLLVLDVINDSIYFGELDFDVVLDEDGEVANFDEEDKRSAIDDFLQDPRRISNPRLVIEEGTIEASQCIKFDERNHNTNCANVFLNFNITLSYRLLNNNTLPSRVYRFTIFY